jgi:hypothetical protein
VCCGGDGPDKTQRLLLNTEEHPEITVSSKKTRKAVFFMMVSPFLESFTRA